MRMRPLPTLFLADAPTMRERVEAAIETLLQLLDEIDGDADLEPTMGYVAHGHVDEAEGENIDDEDDEREDDPAECGVADCDSLAEQYPSAFHGQAI
jgi:hypothetical protein